MGRQPCCEKVGLKRGPWSAEEDRKLVTFISHHGYGCWREVPKLAGLLRCGKSCRLRWTNYLRPDLKRGQLSDAEEKLIIDLHAAIGNRWSRIAGQLPGRTDNEIKNYWNTRIKKRLKQMGIDPNTHKPLNEVEEEQSKSAITSITPANYQAQAGTYSAGISISDRSGADASGCTFNDDNISAAMEDNNKCFAKEMSKREKMELESREAHMKIEKMRAALQAFNCRSPSASVISSPNSVITHATHPQRNTDFEDSSESSSLIMPTNHFRTSLAPITTFSNLLFYTQNAHFEAQNSSHIHSNPNPNQYPLCTTQKLQVNDPIECINDIKPLISIQGSNPSGVHAFAQVPSHAIPSLNPSACERTLTAAWPAMQQTMPTTSATYNCVEPTSSMHMEYSTSTHCEPPQGQYCYREVDEVAPMEPQEVPLNPLFSTSLWDGSWSLMMQQLLEESSLPPRVSNTTIDTGPKIPPSCNMMMSSSYEAQQLVSMLDEI